MLTILAAGSGSTSLAYSTYIGSGSSGTQVRDVWIDPSGNIYIGGTTSDPGLPTTPGVFQRAYAGGPDDAFIAKFSPTGSLLWMSYLGSSGSQIEEKVYGICGYDASGNLTVAGRINRASSYGFGTVPRVFGPSALNNTHAFAAKISQDGSSVAWLDILGGSASEGNRGRCALDSSGNVVGEGETGSTDFPVTSGAYQTLNRNIANGQSQGVLYKVSSNGSSLLWATYVGGSGANGQGDAADGGMALDGSGNVYFAGYTRSSNFANAGAPGGGYQASFRGPGNSAVCYVAKLASNGASLLNWTFLGGTALANSSAVPFAECMALTLDSAGNVLVQGITPFRDQPTTAGAYQTSFGGGNLDGFVSKLSPDLSQLVASTFIGGNGNETGDSSARIEFDSSGNVWTGLTSNSTNFPVTSNAFQRSFQGGGDDEVIAGFTSDLKSLVYGSYLGGNGTDFNRSFRLK